MNKKFHDPAIRAVRRLYKGMVHRVKTDAHYRPLGCSISEDEFIIWALPRYHAFKADYPWASISVDRINAKRGYHIDNIRLRPLPANRIDSALVRKLINADKTPQKYKKDHLRLMFETVASFFGPDFKLANDWKLPILSAEGVNVTPSPHDEVDMNITTYLHPRLIRELTNRFHLNYYPEVTAVALKDPKGVYAITINPQTDIDYDVNERNQIRFCQATDDYQQSIEWMREAIQQNPQYDMTLCAAASAWNEIPGLAPKPGLKANVDGRTRMAASKAENVKSVQALFTNSTNLELIKKIGRRLNCMNGTPPSLAERILYAIDDLKDCDPADLKRQALAKCAMYEIKHKAQDVIDRVTIARVKKSYASKALFGEMTSAQQEAVIEVAAKKLPAACDADDFDKTVMAFADIAHDRGRNLTPELIRNVGNALASDKATQKAFFTNPRDCIKKTVAASEVGMQPTTTKISSSAAFVNELNKLHDKATKQKHKLHWSNKECNNMLAKLEEMKTVIEAKKDNPVVISKRK